MILAKSLINQWTQYLTDNLNQLQLSFSLLIVSSGGKGEDVEHTVEKTLS